MYKLIFSNLKLRPTRTVVSVLAVALGVALILVSVGLSYGQLNDFSARMRRLGDVMVQPSGGSYLAAINSGTISVRIGEKIAEVEGVSAVTPVLTKFLGEQFHLVYGIEKATFGDVSHSFRIVKGQLFSDLDEVVTTLPINYSGRQNIITKYHLRDWSSNPPSDPPTSRLLLISYTTRLAATDTFREDASPNIGILTEKSVVAKTSGLMPRFSLPNRSKTGSLYAASQ